MNVEEIQMMDVVVDTMLCWLNKLCENSDDKCS